MTPPAGTPAGTAALPPAGTAALPPTGTAALPPAGTPARTPAGLVLLLAAAALLLLTLGLVALHDLGRTYVLAAFTTDLEYRTPAQLANIRLAAARADRTRLAPQAVFSFNTVVGERLVENGYDRAPTYEDGDVVDTPGGGICQLTSTIYNAALLSGLRIVERAAHSSRVLSVGPGRDATVFYGHTDLRFANPYDFPLELRTRCHGKRLVAEIVGPRPLPEPVRIRVESVPSIHGIRVRTWRRIGNVERIISEDTYSH